MAVTDETLRAAAEARAQLRRLTDKQAVALVKAWVDAWDTLQPLFAEALAELIMSGKNVPRSVVAKNLKLRAALVRTRQMLDDLTTNANDLILNDVMTAVLDAVDSHQKVIATQLPPGTAGITFNLDAPAPEALQAIVARTTQQVHSSTKPLPKWVEREMKNQLIRGIAVGDNPRRVAQKILKETERSFNGGLARAQTIARTEMLDAHRQASRNSAKANEEILVGWIWTCALDRRTCPSCLSKNGSFHGVNDFGPNDHPNGRCYRVDKTKTWKELGFDIDEPADSIPDARKWYENLSEDSQLAIMGPTRRQLLADGKIQWEDLATTRKSDGWRDSIIPTPVKDLLKVANDG